MSMVIKNDPDIFNAIAIANELWEKALLKNKNNLYSEVNLIQSKLEKLLGISAGKELTVLSGLYRFYDIMSGFSGEDIRKDLIIVAKALKGHCGEMNTYVKHILEGCKFYDQI